MEKLPYIETVRYRAFIKLPSMQKIEFHFSHGVISVEISFPDEDGEELVLEMFYWGEEEDAPYNVSLFLDKSSDNIYLHEKIKEKDKEFATLQEAYDYAESLFYDLPLA
jgi:hypothetical protein